jgi:amino acid adenylation domain-containing protein
MTLGSGWAAEAAPFSLVTEDDDLVSASPAPAADRARSSPRSLQRPMLVRKNADNTIRWSAGERLDHLFEQRCDQFTGSGKDQAVVTDDLALSFRELDNLANQVARYLLDQGIGSGDRVGLLFDRTIDSYVALLAVLKVNAAYVPLDAGFPTERVRFILSDAGVKSVVSLSAFRGKLDEFAVRQILLDTAEREISAKPKTRLSDAEKAPPVDQLAYLIYTSGTTGNPKGVVIEHPSICNFVRVAAELYGFRPGDRVYQGMTIAFDFSVEELWVPLIAGATLVPGKPGASLVGDDLADFLRQRKVTGLCCVPTLLATIEKDLPDLRILLVSGEACPHNLMVRWHRPGRTILNAYGPTEATVTATLTELHPDKPVTIGGPLPTYSIVILDPHKDEALAPGELGEIGIAGIGLAAGYLNRDDLTQKKFIPDFLQIPNNPSGRIYRTGDLGRITETDEVEFHGRIDTQVKIRGYRIELTEIESVLLELPQIAQAAVITHESEPGMVELAAYYSLKQGVTELPHAEVSEALRSRLPAYMVPAYLEHLPIIPMTVSNKADHKKLPAPKGPRFSVGAAKFVAPRGETETILANALAEVLKLERVSAEDNFFKDLGAHSLLMARFCARIRQHRDLSDVSMRDIYLNPTIAKLAAHLGKAVAVVDESPVPAKQLPFRIPSNLEYYGCGALQALFYMATGALGLWVISRAAIWTYAAVDNPGELYLRSLALAAGLFVALTALPIAAKWLLIGRWKQEAIPIWSLRYFRFWVVKTLVQSAPMAAFAGTPIYNLYLRLLGAKIGRNAVILARFIPVGTDLLSIGDNTIIRKDSILLGYKAQSNYIHIGSIAIGDNAFVGEASVLDIDTAMGNDTQLGHTSSLQSGQRVPDGKRYHGSPAQETQADYCPVERMECSSLRRWLYVGCQLVAGFAIIAPIPIVILNHWYPYFVQYTGGPRLRHWPPWSCCLDRSRSGCWASASSRGCSTCCCSRTGPTCCTDFIIGCIAPSPRPAIRGSIICCLATAPSSFTI